MKEERDCPACKGPMDLLSKTYKKAKPPRTGKYRVRKFKCRICDTEETVYADGFRDDNQ